MPDIDVHTHMLTLDYLERLRANGTGKYTLKKARAGQDCQGRDSRCRKNGARVARTICSCPLDTCSNITLIAGAGGATQVFMRCRRAAFSVEDIL